MRKIYLKIRDCFATLKMNNEKLKMKNLAVDGVKRDKNTFLKGLIIFQKKKNVSSRNETEKYRFAEKSF